MSCQGDGGREETGQRNVPEERVGVGGDWTRDKDIQTEKTLTVP